MENSGNDDYGRSLPRNVFKYCPRCSSPRFRFRPEKSFECDDCGFQYFINACAAVVALIEDPDGRLLLVRRGRDPRKGALDLPGGFADPCETAEHAMIREVREELNLEIDCLSYFCSSPNTYLYGEIVYYTLDIAFVCSVKDFSSIKAGDDAKDYLFLAPDEICLEEIGFESIRKIAASYIESKKKSPEGAGQ